MTRQERRKMERSFNKLPNRKSTLEFEIFIRKFREKMELFDSKSLYLYRNTVISTEDFYVNFHENYISDVFFVVNEKFKITLTPKNTGVYIHKIQISPLYQGVGIGSSIMKMLIDISNELLIPIYLYPLPFDEYELSLSQYLTKLQKLKRWYSSLGFRNNTNSDYWKFSPQVIGIEKKIAA